MPAADDDSLNWGGNENDPSYLDGARRSDQPTESRPARSASRNSPALADGGETDAVREDSRHVDSPPTVGSVLLVVYGILAGINVFYIIGWVLAFQRETFAPGNPFLDFMYQLGHVLAIASPVVFYGTVLWLTRHSRAIVRLGWLILGMLLLAPWPFILSGAVR